MINIETSEDFSTVYKQYNKLIRSIVYKMMRGNSVDDLVQESFVKAWKNRRSFEEEKELKNWLCKIAVNSCLDQIRKNKVRSVISFKADIDYLGEVKEGPDTKDLILKALGDLKEEFRAAFVLVVMEGFSVKESSEILKINENTVRTRVFRARESLKIFLKDNGVDSYE